MLVIVTLRHRPSGIGDSDTYFAPISPAAATTSAGGVGPPAGAKPVTLLELLQRGNQSQSIAKQPSQGDVPPALKNMGNDSTGLVFIGLVWLRFRSIFLRAFFNRMGPEMYFLTFLSQHDVNLYLLLFFFFAITIHFYIFCAIFNALGKNGNFLAPKFAIITKKKKNRINHIFYLILFNIN